MREKIKEAISKTLAAAMIQTMLTPSTIIAHAPGTPMTLGQVPCQAFQSVMCCIDPLCDNLSGNTRILLKHRVRHGREPRRQTPSSLILFPCSRQSDLHGMMGP
jgi:hypothetical protein